MDCFGRLSWRVTTKARRDNSDKNNRHGVHTGKIGETEVCSDAQLENPDRVSECLRVRLEHSHLAWVTEWMVEGEDGVKAARRERREVGEGQVGRPQDLLTLIYSTWRI